MLQWIAKKLFPLSKGIHAGYVERELFCFCLKQQRKKILCDKCPIEKKCGVFLSTISDLHFSIIDAKNEAAK